MPQGQPAIVRFLQKIEWSDRRYNGTRCLDWTAAHNSNSDHGRFYVDTTRRSVPAHRWAYERWIGPIPDGFHIDHLCRNERCCNPSHLEAVLPAVNILRGLSGSAKNKLKTHCDEGHEFTPENTYIARLQSGRPARVCKACRRDKMKQYRAEHPEYTERMRARMRDYGKTRDRSKRRR